MASTAVTAPPPAPGEEHHVALALANTRFNAGGQPVDIILSADQASRWLADHGSRARAGRPTAAALRDIREAIRALFGAYVDGTRPPAAAIEAINAVLGQAPTIDRLRWSYPGMPEAERIPIGGEATGRVLAEIAADAVGLLTADYALAACGAPGCIRFLLRSHGKRQWCSTRCGNRIRAARHYTHHSRAAQQPSAT
jgi:predicted RNA-binding Zn ribbon-like protein